MSRIKLFIYSLLALPWIFFCHLLYLYTHREFSPPDFRYSYTFESENIPMSAALKDEVRGLLNQKFAYLGCGKQMTAFESEDHRFVIKFFNPRAVVREKWFSDWDKFRRLCSLRWFSDNYLRRKARLAKLSKRYRLGFEQLREESGLVYVHLGDSSKLFQTLSLTDKQGKAHQIDLDRCPFVLQKKAELATNYLGHLLDKGELEKAKQGIEEICRVLASRAKKGFTDRKQTLHNNYGFVEDRFVQIDLGRLNKDELIEQTPDEEIKRVYSQLHQFLSKRYPNYHSFLDETFEGKF